MTDDLEGEGELSEVALVELATELFRADDAEEAVGRPAVSIPEDAVTPILANVILQAFSAPYVAPCFFPPLALLVVLVEAGALAWWNRQASVYTVVACTVGMNLASYLAGFLLSPWLLVGSGLIVRNPDETGYGILALGPDWYRLAQLAFVQAWAVSVVVEVLVLLPVRNRTGVRRVVLPVLLGNTLSYALLYAGCVLVFGRPTSG